MRLASELARMARELARPLPVSETLDRIVGYAVELVDGCEAAGVMVVRDGVVQTLASSHRLVLISDEWQGELGEGPCFDATRNRHEAYRIADMTTATPRWPRYAPKARELGVGSMMGFLLFTDDKRNLGALDLYSSRPGAFGREHEHVGWLLAAHAAVALAGAENTANLREALETRGQIGEAVGILMARHRLDEQRAFALLVRASQDRNVKLRELAKAVLRAGEIPAGG
jgi:GAF domain-containing protein